MLLRVPTIIEYFKLPRGTLRDGMGPRLCVNQAFSTSGYVLGLENEPMNTFDVIDATARGMMTLSEFEEINSGAKYGVSYDIPLTSEDWKEIHRQIKVKPIAPDIQAQIEEWEQAKNNEPKYVIASGCGCPDEGRADTATPESTVPDSPQGRKDSGASDSSGHGSNPDSPISDKSTEPAWMKKRIQLHAEHTEMEFEAEMNRLAELEKTRQQEVAPPKNPMVAFSDDPQKTKKKTSTTPNKQLEEAGIAREQQKKAGMCACM